jgi:NADH:ubiquinone oxidoreductase subunit H
LFFPYNLTDFVFKSQAGQPLGLGLDLIFFLVKLLIIIVFSVTLIRVAVARLKIDQIVYTYWVPLTLMALVGLICIMWDWQIISEQIFGWTWYQPISAYLGVG